MIGPMSDGSAPRGGSGDVTQRRPAGSSGIGDAVTGRVGDWRQESDIGDAPTARLHAQPAPGLDLPVPDPERYERLEKLGEGGFGVVYKARDRKLDRFVAIKRLRPVAEDDPDGQEALARFRREAKLIASLNHTNVVHIYEHGEDEYGDYIIMEFLGGGTLKDHAKKQGGKLPVEEAVRLIAAVAEGLDWAHRKNLVHRDIKPANILLNREGGRLVPKIADFGLARQGRDTDVSRTGQGMGTAVYMAPEQRTDAKGVNHTADIYALGKTLYELVTGEIPYSVDAASIPPIRGLKETIERCVRNDPTARYFSASELVADLQTVLQATRSGLAATDSQTGGRPAKPGNLPWVGIGVAIILAASLSVYIAARHLRGGVQASPEGAARPTAIVVPTQLADEIAAALRLAYESRLTTPSPALGAQLLVQPGGDTKQGWRALGNGDSLSSRDSYRLLFRPEGPAWVYVFQIDSRGQLDWLFPKNGSPYSAGSNPASSATWTQVPPGGNALRLDENLGVEHLYVVASRERWTDFEAALTKAAGRRSPSGRRIDQKFGLQTRGTDLTRGVGGLRPAGAASEPVEASVADVVPLLEGREGVLVKEWWFRHVAP